MIIDMILDRQDGTEYNAKEFYDEVLAYIGGCGGEYAARIAQALDSGHDIDVKRELCRYIIDCEYNPMICSYINSVVWIEENPQEAPKEPQEPAPVCPDGLIGFSRANGVHWCDKAVSYGGNYKKLAVVRASGKIRWEVTEESIKPEYVEYIKACAKATEEDFMAFWSRLSVQEKARAIMEKMPDTVFCFEFKSSMRYEEIIAKYEEKYFCWV